MTWEYEYENQTFSSQAKAYAILRGPIAGALVCYPGKHTWKNQVRYGGEVVAQVCECGLERWKKIRMGLVG